MFERQREELLESVAAAHAAYYAAGIFRGPSLHFHLRALEAGKARDLPRFTESVYALLAAWGMHRMGRRGSKMVEFEEFQASLQGVWTTILRLQQANPETLNESAWCDLGQVFRGVRCMATGTSLVGNSKVMAHALPNLVPPIDREYTLRFLFGSTNVANGLDREWKKLQAILQGFFYPVVQSEQFKAKAAEWLRQQTRFRWDTSPLKIADNLVIGLAKSRGVDLVEAGA
jgi:hypothetical protein